MCFAIPSINTFLHLGTQPWIPENVDDKETGDSEITCEVVSCAPVFCFNKFMLRLGCVRDMASVLRCGSLSLGKLIFSPKWPTSGDFRRITGISSLFGEVCYVVNPWEFSHAFSLNAWRHFVRKIERFSQKSGWRVSHLLGPAVFTDLQLRKHLLSRITRCVPVGCCGIRRSASWKLRFCP